MYPKKSEIKEENKQEQGKGRGERVEAERRNKAIGLAEGDEGLPKSNTNEMRQIPKTLYK